MIGKTLGHYHVLEELGAGGMGVVYRALDTTLQRPAALKVIEPRQSSDDAARARLLREARLASSLNHPNICTVYEVNEASEGSPAFIAMELVEGRPLSAVIPKNGLPQEQTLHYGTQIADALAHAHDRGVIHRDLKTANVMVQPDGRVKVLDFGLAKRLEVVDADAATMTREEPLTRAGVIVGTLAYMSPETMRGGPGDARSDIWSFGVLLHEMASGRRPFEGTSLSDVTAAILRDTIPELPSSVPLQVQSVIRRCLAKDPGQRYQRAGEVRAALDAIRPTSTVPAAAAARMSHRRWLWGVGATFALVATVVVWTLLWPQPPPYTPPGSTVPEANEYLRLAEYALDTQQDSSRMRQHLERALALDPTFAHARVLYGFSYLLEVDGGLSNDTTLLYRAEEELRHALRDDPNSARAHSVLAFVYYYQGKKELIPEEVAKALAINPKEREAHMVMAFYHQLNGEYDQSQAILKKVLDADPLFPPARANLAENLRQAGDLTGAIREYGWLLEQEPSNVAALAAMAYLNAGDLSRARQILDEARGRQPRNFLNRLLWALLLAVEGKRDEALRAMDPEVIKYARELVLIASFGAEFYAVLGDKAEALEWLDRDVRLGDERGEWFARDPLLANIRDEPKFQQILDSIRSRRRGVQ